jgi:hypothetical protein
MSQRNSGYVRIARDAYQTPAWVTRALIEDLEREGLLPRQDRHGARLAVWEPAEGAGQLSGAFIAHGYTVLCSDIAPRDGAIEHDFLSPDLPLLPPIGAIITNPPYKHADKFVDRALYVMTARGGGLVAMLLSVKWDSAGGRARLFKDSNAWTRKLVLTDRIVWIEHPEGKDHPSEDHAWFIWNVRPGANGSGASIGYGGMTADEKAAQTKSRALRKKAAKRAAQNELELSSPATPRAPASSKKSARSAPAKRKVTK